MSFFHLKSFSLIDTFVFLEETEAVKNFFVWGGFALIHFQRRFLLRMPVGVAYMRSEVILQADEMQKLTR